MLARILAKSSSLSSIWIVYTDEPLMVFSGPIVKVGRFCQSTVEKSTVQSNGGQPTTQGLSRTVDCNANSNPNRHTVNTVTVASVAVNIVTLNYVIVARLCHFYHSFFCCIFEVWFSIIQSIGISNVVLGQFQGSFSFFIGFCHSSCLVTNLVK